MAVNLKQCIKTILGKIQSILTSISSIDSSILNINSKLTDSGWKTLVSNANFYISYRKKNGIVFVIVDHSAGGGKSLITNGWVNLGILPVGYRPTHGHIFVYNGKGNIPGQNANINTDGSIALYSTQARDYYSFATSFPV